MLRRDFSSRVFAHYEDITMLYSLAYLSLLAAIVLAYWPRSIAAREMAKLPGGYNNHEPREQQTRLDGLGRRALAAHLNGLEAIPVFGLGVLAALQRSVDTRWVAALCVLFVAARVLYVLAYLRDRATLRSMMFLLGAMACLVLICFAAFSGRAGS